MALRIACDLDGTLADMELALRQETARLFGPEVEYRTSVPGAIGPDRPAPPASGREARAAGAVRRPLTSAETRRLWAQVRRTENFWAALAEIEPGAVARFAELAAEHRWEVLFITQRPATAGETAQRQSQRWLQAHGFEHPAVYVVTGSRGRVAASLGLHAVVDDQPDHCIDVKTLSAARPILVWRRAQEAAPAAASRLGVDVVTSAARAFDVLEAMTQRGRRDGVFARIRAAIGIS